jgi:DNA/RNA-binding domain of Phe-tRNA-synthetase-like protein
VTVAPELAAEFPALALHSIEVDARSGRSPQPVRERLKEMSNRIGGPRAVQMRQEPVPYAYRVFFRQVGLDPDKHRTAIEQLVLDRLQHGGFPSRNLLDDALTIACFETGVQMAAFDATEITGTLRLRLAEPGELMGAAGRPRSSGQIVIADDERPLAVLFGDLDPSCGVTTRTRRMVIVAIQVPDVPEVAIQEALWTVEEILTGD